MRVSDGLDLISKIGRELQSRYTFEELYSYLWAFEVPRSKDGPVGSKWSYTKAALDPQSNEIILNIAHDLEITAPASNGIAGLPGNWSGSDHFRLFISHIARDRDKATRLKESLAPYFISGFIAHEDIHPTLEWQHEIELALQSMDAMVAIHTMGFSKSYWTQQEIGFALGRGIKIISLKMGEDPTGFISKHQALARRNRKAEDIAAEVHELLRNDERTKVRLEQAASAKPSPQIKDDIPF